MQLKASKYNWIALPLLCKTPFKWEPKPKHPQSLLPRLLQAFLIGQLTIQKFNFQRYRILIMKHVLFIVYELSCKSVYKYIEFIVFEFLFVAKSMCRVFSQ